MDLVEKINHFVSWGLKSILAVFLLISIARLDWSNVFISGLCLLLMFLPSMVMRKMYIELPVEFEFFIVFFVFAAIFLGEVHQYFTKLWWWDVVLHIGSGLALGLAGFIILFSLYQGKKIAASPSTLAIFSFCFALAMGALWEIFEFTMDSNFGLNMQKSGLVDTMWDLIIDACGALVVAVSGFIYLKRGKTYLFEHMLNRFIAKNPKLFRKHAIAKKAGARLV